MGVRGFFAHKTSKGDAGGKAIRRHVIKQSLFSGLFLPFLFRRRTFGFAGLGVGGNSIKSPDVLLHGCFVFLLVKELFGDLHGLNLPFWV
jgi:hypothetical protein